jgi:ferric-dicitrate binding protein FerR (iron transport regulator)
MGASMVLNAATAGAVALEWIVRVQHPEFADWDALSAWLAADPRHAEVFQQLALLDFAHAADMADIGDEADWARLGRRPKLETAGRSLRAARRRF